MFAANYSSQQPQQSSDYFDYEDTYAPAFSLGLAGQQASDSAAAATAISCYCYCYCLLTRPGWTTGKC